MGDALLIGSFLFAVRVKESIILFLSSEQFFKKYLARENKLTLMLTSKVLSNYNP